MVGLVLFAFFLDGSLEDLERRCCAAAAAALSCCGQVKDWGHKTRPERLGSNYRDKVCAGLSAEPRQDPSIHQVD